VIWAVSLSTNGASPPQSDSQATLIGIRSLIKDGIRRPALIQCSTPYNQRLRLALKLFRGEPAIAEFDWNFSANHSSSPDVARSVGSVLLPSFDDIQPGHG
jgi:hypothetical protein